MRLTTWLLGVRSNLTAHRRRSSIRHSGLKTLAAAEMLEARALLAATITLNTTTKELLVTGTTLDDVATVEPVTATTFKVRVVTGASAVERTFALSAVNKIRFNAGAGNDSLTDTTDRPVSMTGGVGNDTLLGGTGDDTLDGGANNDSVNGGAGNDLLIALADADFVLTDLLLTGQGNDSLFGMERVQITGGVSANSITAPTATLMLTAFGGGGNDSILGGLRNDRLEGGAGNDVLSGGGGNDTLQGGQDNDSLTGGLGNDSLVGGLGTADILVEVISGTFILTANGTTGSLGTDTYSGFEGASLTGGTGADTINASAAKIKVTLRGGAGNDTLQGGSGDDSLQGNTGNDWLVGGLGADTIIGQAGTDRLVESGDTDFRLSASVVSGVMTGQLTGLGIDTLLDLEAAQLTGGGGANRLDVSAWGLPSTLTGGLGNDTLVGGIGLDVLSESGNVNFNLTDWQLTGVGTDSLSGIDRAILSGGDGANLIDASAATKPVTVNGGAGNDTLKGGFAADRLGGGLGNDLLYGNDGNDTVLGGDGTDTVLGVAGNDSLDGGNGNDVVLGGFGNDTLLGGYGRDFLIGDAGTDSLAGGPDDDLVLGSSYKYDTNLPALVRVLSDWSSTATYLNRVSTLQNTSHPYFLKSLAQITDNATLYDDYSKDTVVGGSGSDLFLRPGQPGTTTLDVTPDRLSTETMNVSTFGTASPGYFPTNMTKPGYLSTLNDPTFGTPITRVTGDAGALLTIPINTGGTASLYWSGNVRTRYVTDSNWNIDGSLMMLRSYDPALRYQIVLNGNTYQPMFLASIPSTNFRWSQDPTKPNIQYAFPQLSWLDAPPGPDDDKIIQYDITTGQVFNTITLPFKKLFSSKTTIGLVNGHEYAAMLGVDKLNPSASKISVYVVDLNPSAGQSPVVASMLLTTADSGTPEAAYAAALDFDNLWFSPDGQHILILYNGSTVNTRSWRLLDVDYTARAIAAHVMPNLTGDDTFQTNGDPTKGHFPVNWSHPVFAFGPNGTDVYVVGNSGQYNKRTFAQNEVTTANGQIGSVLAFHVTNNTFHSLTDPTNENQATHITATNTQHPGYIFASYWNDLANGRGTKYAGEIIAINLADPFGANGTIELVHHRTNIANNDYYANTLPTVSPNGTKLIFSSTWGTLQSVVQSFVLDLRGMVP